MWNSSNIQGKKQIKISFHEEVNSGLKSGNVSYNSVQNLFVFQLTIQKCKDYDIQILTLPVVCMGVKLDLSH